VARQSPSVKSAARDKEHKVMSEFKGQTLHAGSKSGPLVRNRKQAIAIAISEAKRARKRSA
jgi:hypothetical protein